ncbi:ABC transporter ATP-binding protein, partial [Rhizobium leguminosarum]
SMGFVSPAARLAIAWDTKLGGALAVAIRCNSVVKAFGADGREEVRLRHVMAKWDSRTRRTWKRGTMADVTNNGFHKV